MNPPVRVFLVDDVGAFRALMRFTLEEDPRIQVVGEAADGCEGVNGVEELKPDVVLLDLAMPVLDGFEAMPLILERSPGTTIVALSGFTAERMAALCIESGAYALAPHPVQDRTDDELRAMARDLADQVLAAIRA